MILIRIFLISVAVYLLVRAFMKSLEPGKPDESRSHRPFNDEMTGKKISKKIGEYVDFEETGKKKKIEGD